MVLILIIKEIHESLITYRFLIATLLCLILIPLQMYVSFKDYDRRYLEYQNSIHLYQEKSEGRISASFVAEGFRPPSPLSIFSFGYNHTLPQKVTTSRDGEFKIEFSAIGQNQQSVLYGQIDFAFILSFVLSIIALILIFHSISGEKELGSLRLLMSNSIPKWQIIISKISGNYIIFLLPLFIGLLIGLIILLLNSGYPLFSQKILPSIITILIISMIFIFIIFNLGIFVSSRTNRSITSMITVIFLWVILVLVIPKISPLVAQIIYPIKSEKVLNSEVLIAKGNLDDKYKQKRRDLLKEMILVNGIDYENFIDNRENSDVSKVLIQYDKRVLSIEQEFDKEYALTVKKIKHDYNNKKQTQANVAIFISRISPVCCYLNVLSEISGTGVSELENFYGHAQQFQQFVANTIYNNYTLKRYYDRRGVYTSVDWKRGFDHREVAIPHLTNYKHVSLTRALAIGWIDIIMLILYAIIFFSASYVSFMRYDVR